MLSGSRPEQEKQGALTAHAESLWQQSNKGGGGGEAQLRFKAVSCLVQTPRHAIMCEHDPGYIESSVAYCSLARPVGTYSRTRWGNCRCGL